jgi:hypothetical protein
MGLPWTIKESVTGLDLKEEKGNGQRSVMGSQKLKIHNWMISEREV